MEMEAIVTSVNHTLTGIYAIRSRSNFLSVFISNEIEENDIFGTEYHVVMDESSFSFKTSGEGAPIYTTMLNRTIVRALFSLQLQSIYFIIFLFFNRSIDR